MLYRRALDTPRPTPPDARPDFDLDELIDEYRLGSIQDVCKVRGGTVNKNWIVRTTMAVVVVRIVPKNVSRSDINFEHSFIKALSRIHFPYQLPQPLRTRNGRTVVRRNGGYVWIYRYIEASKPLPPRDEVIAQIAQCMATAHKAAQSLSLSQVKHSPTALQDLWLLHMLRHWQLKLCGSLDERCRFFGAHVQECIGILEQLRCTGYDRVARLPIHGDMCRANVVFSRKRLSGIIDFGHCCFDTAIRDITIALRYECANINEDFKLDLVSARKFLRAYNKISPLSPQQIELIPAIAMAEAVDLLWWTIFQITNTRVPQASMRSVEAPIKTLKWYQRHQFEIGRALRL